MSRERTPSFIQTMSCNSISCPDAPGQEGSPQGLRHRALQEVNRFWQKADSGGKRIAGAKQTPPFFTGPEELKIPGIRETCQKAMGHRHCTPASHGRSCMAKNQSPLIFSLSRTQCSMKAGDRSPAGIVFSAAGSWTAIGNRFYLFSLRRGIPCLFIVMRIQKNGLTIRSWQGPEGFS